LLGTQRLRILLISEFRPQNIFLPHSGEENKLRYWRAAIAYDVLCKGIAKIEFFFIDSLTSLTQEYVAGGLFSRRLLAIDTTQIPATPGC